MKTRVASDSLFHLSFVVLIASTLVLGAAGSGSEGAVEWLIGLGLMILAPMLVGAALWTLSEGAGVVKEGGRQH